MKGYINLRTVLYVIYTVALFVVVYMIDSVPDHSDGTADYSLWCKFLYFPVLMTYHGLMSGVILRGYRIWTPLVITAVVSLIEGVFVDSTVANLLFDGANLPTPIKTTCYFLIFTAIGLLIMKVCRRLYLGIRVITAAFKR